MKNPRRFIRWDAVKGPKAFIAVTVGTACGSGLVPFAPGTMGTLFGLPFVFYSAGWEWPYRVGLWLALLAIGTWAAKVFDETMGSSDNQCIVIDEVVGIGITAWTAGTDPKALAASFVLFRFFDIFKFPPVRQLDRWSKTQSRWLGGFGVMADDVLAGFQGLAVILLLQYLKVI